MGLMPHQNAFVWDWILKARAREVKILKRGKKEGTNHLIVEVLMNGQDILANSSGKIGIQVSPSFLSFWSNIFFYSDVDYISLKFISISAASFCVHLNILSYDVQVSSFQGKQGYTGGIRTDRKDAWHPGTWVLCIHQ